MTYRGSPSQYEQQNYPLSLNYALKRDKKYTYCHSDAPKSLPQCELEQLRRELREEREKVKALEARTIQEQCTVLNHLQLLQGKFQQLSTEKQAIQQELRRVKEENEWKAKYEELQEQHRHIKGIADSMISMMRKCEGTEGTLHDSWRWVKRVVWQYQGIRKKALQWKQVYDQVTQALPLPMPPS